jgi:hypothetical protein
VPGDQPAAIVLPLTVRNGTEERALIREASHAASAREKVRDTKRISRCHALPGGKT